jgi:sortase A
MLLVAGGALVTHASARYASAAVLRDQLHRQWSAEQARLEVAQIQGRVLSGEVAERIVAGTPVARLRIPRLGVDEIVVSGVDDALLDAAPGHLPGSVLPGDRGNAVISAHRDLHFRPLGQLRLGDTVYTELGRRRVGWRVSDIKVVHRTAPALFETDSPALTLTTCWPIRYVGPAPQRLIVTAVPLG